MRQPTRVGAAGTAALLAGAGVEVVAASTVPGWNLPQRWLPDLVTGWALVGVALLARRLSGPDARPVQVLCWATSVCWFLGTVSSAGQFWHRATLLGLLVATTCVASPLRTVMLVLAGLTASITAAGLNAWLTAVATLVIVVVSWRSVLRVRRLRATGVGALLWGATLVWSAAHSQDASAALLAVYQAEVVLVAATCVFHVAGGSRIRLADLMVSGIELGPSGLDAVERALRAASRDRSLRLAVWDDPARAYRDSAGQVLDPATLAEGRWIGVERPDDHPRVLLHDQGAPGATVLRQAAELVGQLLTEHRRLEADLRARLDQVAASRRRLVLAADDEHRRLELSLRTGPLGRLVRLRTELADLASAEHDLEPALIQLDRTVQDLERLARGLHPHDLEAGLAAALRSLATRSPIPVTVETDDVDDLDGPVAQAVYLTTAEALTNANKHSQGQEVRIRAHRTDDRVVWTVQDDGTGAADVAGGTGIQGMVERVAALGGRLTVDAEQSRGTVVSGWIPLPVDTDRT